MKRLFAFFAVLVLCAGLSFSAIYYVDATSGNDSWDGLAPAYVSGTNGPWKTIAKAQTTLTGNQSDNSCLLKCGERWREAWVIGCYGTNSHPFIIASYGTGAKPIIDGTDLLSGTWDEWAVGAIYRLALTTEPSVTFLNGKKGLKQALRTDVNDHFEWAWYLNNIYVYARLTPASYYTNPGVEVVTRNYGIDINGNNYITINDIVTTKTGLAGIRLNSGNSIIIDGIESYKNVTSGILLDGTAADPIDGAIIRKSLIKENSVDGILINGEANGVINSSINYNIIYSNIGDGVKINQSGTANVLYNDTIYGSGLNGIETAAISGWTVKNNNLVHAGGVLFLAAATSTITHSNNSYYKSHENLVTYNGTSYASSDIATFEPTAKSSEPLDYETYMGNQIKSICSKAGVIYAGTSTLVIKSTDGGTTWTTKLTFSTSGTVRAVYVDSRGYVYASQDSATAPNGEKGIWRSVDGGDNWTRVLDWSAFSNNVTTWNVTEDSSGRLFTGLYGNTATPVSKIYRSTDSGATWSIVWEDLVVNGHVHQVYVDPYTDYIYALNDPASGGLCLYRSIDHGDTWANILNTTATQLRVPALTGIVSTPTARIMVSDSNAYAAIFRTTDDTAHTIVFKEDNPYFIFWVKYDTATQTLFAGMISCDSYYVNAKIYYSKDDGLTWSLFRVIPTGSSYLGPISASDVIGSQIYVAHATGNWLKLNIKSMYDFRLLGGSPCINAGTDVGLTEDYEGRRVPRGSAPDIGVYEYARFAAIVIMRMVLR